MVVTIRALKYHGGVSLGNLDIEDTGAVEKGLVNMEKHLENIRQFNLTPIVAINKFTHDSVDEINTVLNKCKELGVDAFEADVWGKGGSGAIELAEKVVSTSLHTRERFTPIYKWNEAVETKIKAIASKIYGAKAIDYTLKAKQDLRKIVIKVNSI